MVLGIGCGDGGAGAGGTGLVGGGGTSSGLGVCGAQAVGVPAGRRSPGTNECPRAEAAFGCGAPI